MSRDPRPVLRRRLLAAVVLLAACTAVRRPLAAQDAPAPPAAPLSDADAKVARAELDEAVALQERRQYAAARKKLVAWLARWPGADPAWRTEAEDRSEDNAFLGLECIHRGGPSENRIDVELMGDGYLLTQQDTFRKHAEAQLKEFWREPLYDEYGAYLNVWRFDLASKEEGVDEVARPAPEGDAGRRRKRPLKEYSTALDCQAAGPQNQVWADPEMVFRWRKYLKESDGLSICFAKKGELGMGGMGIATTGRRVAVVHEFGHAFVGLLDEYAVNPGSPPGRVAARNAISGKGPKEPPDVERVPWRHWLDAKNPEVGVFLGGATFQEGVFRPAASCAMNAGGGGSYCWVCREAGVLKLYEYVNPVDEATPASPRVTLASGATATFSVVPLAPKSHRLSTEWFLERVRTRVVTDDDEEDDGRGAGPVAPAAPPPEAPPVAHTPDGWSRGPLRGHERHANPWPPGPPNGEPVDAKEKAEGRSYRSTVTLEKLTVGRYRLTARVRDDAQVPGYRFPWVLRDPVKLLEERRTWEIEVR